MQYQVFVQNPADRTFMASIVGLPHATANGVTEQEAIDKLKSILDTQFKNGKMVTIEIDLPREKSPEKSDPWIDNIGIFQDDPTFDEFLSEVNAYRNEIDRIEAYQ
ncbi:type II toxin-antitoxin system HicB family antitoxin [Chamaesiphon sp. VAR_48_metabat_403]|uniref:type II toxin-antitoxin system HicB family antitoxin n=1 Tax=Chamaesiphon sp. VAR_48_metabat_403 TaxID=2964700 RepID=UPI00286D8F1A|nr:type II toxin-antitoxin system HicB family antitoxin [Chamaesiphon sp. VAR_48_metabat_403]